jgi:hypothetical protein
MKEEDLVFFIENLECLEEQPGGLTQLEENQLIAARELLWNLRNPENEI